MMNYLPKQSWLTWIWMVVCTLAIQAQQIEKEGDHYRIHLVQSFEVEAGGQLLIRNVSGNIWMKSWDQSSVEIREELRLDVFTEEEARIALQQTRSSYQKTGNSVIVDGRKDRHWIQRHFKIMLPQRFDVTLQLESGNIDATALNGRILMNTSGGNISLNSAAGDIELKSAGGNLHLENIAGPLEASTSGGNIFLQKLSADIRVRTGGGNISLSDAQQHVEVRTAGGGIEIAGVAGPLIAHTAGGDIEARDCTAEAELHTAGGDITLYNMENKLDVRTSGGDISGENIQGPLTAETSGGDIELTAVRGAVNAVTSAGNVEVILTIKDFQKDHRLVLKTTAGDIHLTVPEKLPASIVAEIDDSEGRWKRYDIYSDFPLSTERDSQRRILRRSGDINGGGDKIILKTAHGDIHIKRGG